LSSRKSSTSRFRLCICRTRLLIEFSLVKMADVKPSCSEPHSNCCARTDLPAPESPSMRVSEPSGMPPPILESSSALPVETIARRGADSAPAGMTARIFSAASAVVKGLIRMSAAPERSPSIRPPT